RQERCPSPPVRSSCWRYWGRVGVFRGGREQRRFRPVYALEATRTNAVETAAARAVAAPLPDRPRRSASAFPVPAAPAARRASASAAAVAREESRRGSGARVRRRLGAWGS